MRKNLEKDEPDSRWTSAEILSWIKDNGVMDEAKGLGNEKQHLQKPPKPFKDPE
jgi:hypothetical protein